MKRNKVFWVLAFLAAAVLSAAAVWLGGLNQDEGWYLYAANLVHAGNRVYRDFAYTQGPVMPKVYSAFTWIWSQGGLLGARVFTLLIGLASVAFAALTARRLARANVAALVVVLLLGCNLYHLYYLAIPKTYALATLFVMAGVWCLAEGDRVGMRRFGQIAFLLAGGLSLGLAAGVRISLGAILPVIGVALLVRGRDVSSRHSSGWFWYGVGGAAGLLLSYGFIFCDAATWRGFLAAQQYHAARGGFDVTWVVGSLSRLVRWYLPVFIVLGLGVAGRMKAGGAGALPLSFLAVFAVQMLAPFPYEDYQVPIMGLLAVYAAVTFVSRATLASSGSPASAHTFDLLLVLGLAFATSFGSPLLEKWMTNGQDRFWSLKKDKSELAQLRDVAKEIEALDPNGTDLLTQDLYLAIETNRKVPRGLEMGPFSMMTDAEWQTLLSSVTCPVAALSGYTFAIEPPVCNERPVERQMAYWSLLKRNYKLVAREDHFGQNATPLLILRRRSEEGTVKP